MHPDDLRHIQAVFERVVSDGGASETLTFRVLNANGDWVWVEEVPTNLLDDPNVCGIVCNGRDVTERVSAEQALKESEARYRAIAETAQEGIWLIDITGRTLFANQRLAEQLGTDLATVYARPVQPGSEPKPSCSSPTACSAAAASVLRRTSCSTRIPTARRGSCTSR